MEIRVISIAKSWIRDPYLSKNMKWECGNMVSSNLWDFETNKPWNQRQATKKPRNHKPIIFGNKKPRNQTTKKPKNKKPINHETKTPINQKPRNQTKKQETETPRNQSSNKPKTKKPRGQDTKKPRNQSTNFLRFSGRILGFFFGFSGNASKICQKGKNKGAEMDAFSMEFHVFPENAKMRFDYAGASRLRFRPLLFLLCASIFAHLFLHRFFKVFGPPCEAKKVSSVGKAGPP